ncbi:MAG: DNA repair protein RecO [Deltaproteobacteria bacterium]
MILSTPAFVLRSYDFRETSKIAIFYTRDDGKVKGVLKGIRKDPRKFGSRLGCLSLNHIVYYKKRVSEIHLVSQCDLIEDFFACRAGLTELGVAHVAAELVDSLMPAEEANRQVFELLFEFLNRLDAQDGPHRAMIFQIKMLSLSGFRPHFDSCCVCDARVRTGCAFSDRKGGLLCDRCRSQDPKAEAVYPGTIATILHLESHSLAAGMRLKMHASVRAQLAAMLERFMHFHVGKRLRSERVLHQILDLSRSVC